MIELVFEGHSDDLFGETNHFNHIHDNCATGEPIEFLLESGDHSILVTGQFHPGNSGSWMIGVANYDPNCDDSDFPDWHMEIKPQNYRNGFQPMLIINAPDDVKIKCLQE